MGVLVSAGVLVYGLAAILLGAFSKADLALLLRRKRPTNT
jgi:putative peptidoglycan lipid II flippase